MCDDSGFWFACLKKDDVFRSWDQIGPLLDKAVQKTHGELVLDDVATAIDEESLYVAVMGCGVQIVLAVAVEFEAYPKMKVMNVVLMGGSHAKHFFRHHFQFLKDFAREVGCSSIQCSCGKAEARLFQRYSPEVETVYQVLRTKV